MPRAQHPLLLAAALGLAACTHEVSVGPEATEIVFGVWDRVGVVALAVGLGFGAFVFLRRPRRWLLGLVLAFLAAVAVVAAASVMAGRIVLTTDEVYDQVGFPWDREKLGFRFEEVQEVSLFDRRVQGARTSHVERVWSLGRRDGSREEMVVGDLWRLGEAEILRRLAKEGVRVVPWAGAAGNGDPQPR